jgi:hypothetical protein
MLERILSTLERNPFPQMSVPLRYAPTAITATTHITAHRMAITGQITLWTASSSAPDRGFTAAIAAIMAALVAVTTVRDTALGPAMVTDRGMATGPDMLIDQGMAIGQDTATGALLPAALSEAATVVAMHAAASAGIVVVDFTAEAPTVVAGTAAEAPTVVAAFMAVAGTASSERFNSRMDFHRMENCRSSSLPSPPPSRSIASTGDSATFFT